LARLPLGETLVNTPFVVAVDGPSGSGKSSTARGVARRLGLAYLDTGAMYRAITWALLQREIDLHDTVAVEIDGTDLTLDEVIDAVASLVEEARGR
jgi:cytidylate kinase